jgi:hypothetical protein
MAARDDWVSLRSFDTGLEADMACLRLQAADIPFLLRSDRAGVFGLTFQGSVPGGIVLLVPTSVAVRAREVLEEDGE